MKPQALIAFITLALVAFIGSLVAAVAELSTELRIIRHAGYGYQPLVSDFIPVAVWFFLSVFFLVWFFVLLRIKRNRASKMARCTKCGSEMTSEAKFCPECGAKCE